MVAHWLAGELKQARIAEPGRHYGVSLCSFREAAQAVSPDTLAYPVDTWEGDDYAGHQGEDVHTESQRSWSRHHHQGSRMIFTPFDEAAQHLQHHSMDILRIDGPHTYDAVKDDYMT